MSEASLSMQQIWSLILLSILFILFLSLWGFYFAIRPIKIISPVTPKNFGIDYEPVDFKTVDNLLIKAWFIPNKNPQAKTIILLHGYPADKGDILSSRIFLHNNYNLLFMDFRYFGESEGKYSTIGKNEVLDLQAALRYLHQRNIHEVGVWGLSLGAAVALLTAPDAPEIKAIVAEAPYARLDLIAYDYYRLPGFNYIMGKLLQFWARIFLQVDVNTMQPVKAVEKLKIPLLLLYSKKDEVIGYQHAILMQEAAKQNSRAEVLIIENLRHGELMENYQEKIKDFFERHLR